MEQYLIAAEEQIAADASKHRTVVTAEYVDKKEGRHSHTIQFVEIEHGPTSESIAANSALPPCAVNSVDSPRTRRHKIMSERMDGAGGGPAEEYMNAQREKWEALQAKLNGVKPGTADAEAAE